MSLMPLRSGQWTGKAAGNGERCSVQDGSRREEDSVRAAEGMYSTDSDNCLVRSNPGKGGSLSQDGEHRYTCGGFISIFANSVMTLLSLRKGRTHRGLCRACFPFCVLQP